MSERKLVYITSGSASEQSVFFSTEGFPEGIALIRRRMSASPSVANGPIPWRSIS